jgi:hypothetical protein
MSTELALPTEEQAKESYAYMAQEIYAPAFFEKLAAQDIRPQNEKEAQQLLQLGDELAAAEAQGLHKASADAGDGDNPFLTHALNRVRGVSAAAVAPEDRIKHAGAQLAHQDTIAKNAALIYGHMLQGGEITSAEQPAEKAPKEQSS